MHAHVYDLTMPATRLSSVIFASPHSGREYPRGFQRSSILDALAIRSSEDAFVDMLVSAAPDHGAPLLAAKVPRAYVDLNRGDDELDPALIRDVPKNMHNPRIASGLGVIPRVVANGRAIYRGKITRAEAEARLARYWHPYHARLAALLDETHQLFGEAVLIDVHSMPHEAIDSLSRGRGAPPEVVLGDRFGASAAPAIVERIEAAFAAAGLRVALNAPFAGAFTAQHYGRPSRNRHVVQIEIDRALYMNEQMIRPNGNFQAFRTLMSGIVAEIAGIGWREQPLAAE